MGIFISQLSPRSPLPPSANCCCCLSEQISAVTHMLLSFMHSDAYARKKIKQMLARGWQGCKRSDTGNTDNTQKSIQLESERIKLSANPKCRAEVLSHF